MDPERHVETDSELLRQALNGHVMALCELVDRHMPHLFSVARSLVGNRADAEDLVQETILAVLDGLPRFAGQSSLKTWMTGILVKQVAAWRRRQHIRRTSPLAPESHEIAPRSAMAFSDSASAADIRMDVQAALDALSPQHREVLVLRELGGLSYDEISAALGLPRGTVESRIHRARLELRGQMKGYA